MAVYPEVTSAAGSRNGVVEDTREACEALEVKLNLMLEASQSQTGR